MTGNEVSCLTERHLVLDCVPCTAPFVLSLSKEVRKPQRQRWFMVRVHGAALRAGFMTGLPRFARNDGVRRLCKYA